MLHETEVVPRLIVAVGPGAAIGFERQPRHKVLGLRTHSPVSLACALVMGVSELLNRQVPMATGIRTRATVTRIFTAATIWLTAAPGVVVGAGFYLVALTATALTFVTLHPLERVERRAGREEALRELQAKTETLRQPAQVIDALAQTRAGGTPPPYAPTPGPIPWRRRVVPGGAAGGHSRPPRRSAGGRAAPVAAETLLIAVGVTGPSRPAAFGIFERLPHRPG